MGSSETASDNARGMQKDSGFMQEELSPFMREVDDGRAVGLLDLSDDVLLWILQYCDARDLKALGFSCRRLGLLVCDRTLWRRVVSRAHPCGAARLRWYISRAHTGTVSVAVAGHARRITAVNDDQYPCNCMKTSGTLPSMSSASGSAEPCARPLDDMRLPRFNDTLGFLEPVVHLEVPIFTATPPILMHLTSRCPRLHTLELTYCNVDWSVTNMSQFPPTLKRLSLRGCRSYKLPANKSCMSRVHQHLPLLEDLDVSEFDGVEGVTLLPISKLLALRRLCMRNCKRLHEFVAYASLSARYGFRALQVLDVRGSTFSDSEMSAFGWLPLLEELYISPEYREDPSPFTVEKAAVELEPWELEEPAVHSQASSRCPSPSPSPPPQPPLSPSRVLTVTIARNDSRHVNVHLRGPFEPPGENAPEPPNENAPEPPYENEPEPPNENEPEPPHENEPEPPHENEPEPPNENEPEPPYENALGPVNEDAPGRENAAPLDFDMPLEAPVNGVAAPQLDLVAPPAGQGVRINIQGREVMVFLRQPGEANGQENVIIVVGGQNGRHPPGNAPADNPPQNGQNNENGLAAPDAAPHDENGEQANAYGIANGEVHRNGENDAADNEDPEATGDVDEKADGPPAKKRKMNNPEIDACAAGEPGPSVAGPSAPGPSGRPRRYVKFRRNLPPMVVDVDEAPDADNAQNAPDEINPNPLVDNQIRDAPNANPIQNQHEGQIRQPNPQHAVQVHRQNNRFYIQVENEHANEPFQRQEYRIPMGEQVRRIPCSLLSLRNSHLPIYPPLLVTDATLKKFGHSDDEEEHIIRIDHVGAGAASDRPNKSKLKRLVCEGYCRITNRSLAHLATAAPELEYVDMRGTMVTDNGVQAFKALRPDCEVLWDSDATKSSLTKKK